MDREAGASTGLPGDGGNQSRRAGRPGRLADPRWTDAASAGTGQPDGARRYAGTAGLVTAWNCFQASSASAAYMSEGPPPM